MKRTIIISTVLAAILSFASCGNVNEKNTAVADKPAAANANNSVNEKIVVTETPVNESRSAEETESVAEDIENPVSEAENTDAYNNTVSENTAVENVTSYDNYEVSTEQAASTDDIRDSQRDEQVRAAVDTLDKQIEIAYGGSVDIREKYDSDFELNDDPAATAYYLIPDNIRSDYDNFDSTMRSGPFTENFLIEQGLDNISERIAEHDGAMLFKRDYCRATRPLHYAMLDNEIYSGQNADSCYVNVFDGIDSYQLNFVYDANTGIWKMDSMI